jgi:hypothetical protein
MRKLIVVALAAAAVAVPSAVAAQGGTPGKPADPAPAASAKKPVKSVAFIVKGVVSMTNADGTFVIDVKGGNAHAKKLLGKMTGFIVKTGQTTRFSKGAKVAGKATFANIATNDRVLVRYSAPRPPSGSNAGYLSALVAKRIVDQGPKPAS